MHPRYLLAALGIAIAASSASARVMVPRGVWANPSNSVHVAFKPCGPAMCGTVIWANEKAIADAQRGGTSKLIGQQLFQQFVSVDTSHWTGKVFVPDIGQSIAGTITQTSARTLVGEGCVVAGFACKSQEWKRIQ